MNDNKTPNQNRLQLFVEMINQRYVVLRIAGLSQVKSIFHHLLSPPIFTIFRVLLLVHFLIPSLIAWYIRYIPAIYSCSTFARYWETSFSPWPAWSSSLPTGLWDLPCLPQATSWRLIKSQTVFLLTENQCLCVFGNKCIVFVFVFPCHIQSNRI